MYLAGRLLTLASTGVESPHLSRPKNGGKKDDLNPHGYWLHAAPLNTTSYRRTAYKGGYCLDAKIKNKSVGIKSMVGWPISLRSAINSSLLPREDGLCHYHP